MFSKTFPEFPEFKHLELSDKDEYYWYAKNFPPMSDLSFTTLFIWWNFYKDLAISTINDNLVISYKEASDPNTHGLALIGTSKVYDSINKLLNYRVKIGSKNNLIHVPYFVIDQLSDKQKLDFKIEEETDYSEYILDAHKISSLDSPDLSRVRRKVKRFIREAGGNIEVFNIDLNNPDETKSLINAIHTWDNLYSHNDIDRNEATAMSNSIGLSNYIDTKCLGVYVDKVLHAFSIYQISNNKECVIVNHIKTSGRHNNIFDFVTQQIALKAIKAGANKINFEMDLGIPGLRFHKQSLRPTQMLRKYSIEKA